MALIVNEKDQIKSTIFCNIPYHGANATEDLMNGRCQKNTSEPVMTHGSLRVLTAGKDDFESSQKGLRAKQRDLKLAR